MGAFGVLASMTSTLAADESVAKTESDFADWSHFELTFHGADLHARGLFAFRCRDEMNGAEVKIDVCAGQLNRQQSLHRDNSAHC